VIFIRRWPATEQALLREFCGWLRPDTRQNLRSVVRASAGACHTGTLIYGEPYINVLSEVNLCFLAEHI
jgi:hypothetical protein